MPSMNMSYLGNTAHAVTGNVVGVPCSPTRQVVKRLPATLINMKSFEELEISAMFDISKELLHFRPYTHQYSEIPTEP